MKYALPALLLLCYLYAPAQKPQRNGRDYAVFFYVTRFQPGWQALPETKPEAEALAAELRDNYGFTCALVANPTRQQIRDTLAAYNLRLKSEDQVLYFFSMHGYYDKNSDLGFLVAADGKLNDPYYESYLNYNELRPYFSACKARHILVALDACYSGSFGLTREKSEPEGPDYEQEADCATQISTVLKYTGRQYVCAGNYQARTPAKSAFAAKFLEALRRGPNAEGLLFFGDLSYWLGKVQNPEPVHGTFSGHDPGGDFVFARTNACAPAPDRDGDGVPDAADACPDDWGSLANGCSPDNKPDQSAEDLAAWRQAKQTDSAAAYREYLRRFPQGAFKEEAGAALRIKEAAEARQRDDTAWEIAKEKNTLEAYKMYLAEYPNGAHKSEAEGKVRSLEQAAAPVTPVANTPPATLTDPLVGTLVLVKGGTFQMGSENGESDEKPVHLVTLSDYYIGQTEVTQAQWRAVMGSDPPGLYFRGCDNCPVEGVSWDDIQEFLSKLNARSGGGHYRLPTEAEWEYAARGGRLSKGYAYAGSNNFEEVAWYYFNSANKTHPVKGKAPNELGLYDMSGNVSEWCADWYGNYTSGSVINPTGATSGSGRVYRGGGWFSNAESCRASYRHNHTPGYRFLNLGFRVVFSPR